MAGQGRRLRHTGARGALHPPDHRLLFQRGRSAAVRDGQPPRRPRLRAGAAACAARPVSRTLLIAASPGELWAALLEDEALRGLRAFRAAPPLGPLRDMLLP